MSDTDIMVYLGSSKYIRSMGQKEIKDMDIPICLAIVELDKPAKRLNKTILKGACRGMAQEVYISREKKLLFIGENHNDLESALIEYDIRNSDVFGDEFIKRWEATKTLLFEYNVYDKKKKYLFTLNGLWDDIKNGWSSLKIISHRISIIKNNFSETIISRG